jgi:hypothetical protein
MTLTLTAINLNCTDFLKIFDAFNHVQISSHIIRGKEEKP